MSVRHFDRLERLIDGSAEQVVLGGMGAAHRETKFIPPTVVVDPKADAPIMQEEIFGPALAVVTVSDLEAAVDFINRRDSPLALYVFTGDQKRAESVIRRTNSGGVLVNDTFIHLGNYNLPFGGVGPSGMGEYHGKHGFLTFSHKRAVLKRPLWPDPPRFPPYDDFKNSLNKRLSIGPLLSRSEKMGAISVVALVLWFFRGRISQLLRKLVNGVGIKNLALLYVVIDLIKRFRKN